jgi:hypothetical protein
MYRHLIEMDKNPEVKVQVSFLLSIMKNLKKVSHNISAFENYLGDMRDWNEAMKLRENRIYIDSLHNALNTIVTTNSEEGEASSG